MQEYHSVAHLSVPLRVSMMGALSSVGQPSSRLLAEELVGSERVTKIDTWLCKRLQMVFCRFAPPIEC